ncbi:adenylate/guanylate cyclase domain-containing protein [bacterium]|nr:adenylate/guanylate cyclase domain-containing protein [bacterium]
MSSARRHGLLIGAAATVLSLLLWSTGALEGWERTTWDWRARLFAKPGPATDQVVLVLLDQPSLDWASEQLGLPWPWPREVYGPVLDFCARGGARATAFDVLYTEPSVYGVYDDEALGEAITRHGGFVGARFLEIHPDRAPAAGVTEPIPEVAGAAALLANVSDQPDPDGIFRRAGLLAELAGETAPVPSLGVGAWLLGEPDASLDALTDRAHLRDDGTALLRYRGNTEVFTTYSAAALIQSELRLQEGGEPVIDPEALRDRYVLFGFSAPGLLDLRPTPVSRVSPGVLVHATALDNLLSDGFMRDVPRWVVMLGVALLALLAGLLMTGITSTRATVPLAVVLLAIPAADALLAYPLGWWAPVLPGTVAAAAAVFGGLVRNYAVEGRQRRFIKSAFQHYLSPAVIEKVLVDPDALSLGGERRELTIMFSDLAGFTSLSEGMDPESLTTLLNDYLTDMTDIILEEGGTLDKYEGDAILAFWNAPTDQPDHAERACRAAVRCQEALAARRPEFAERSGKELFARIGLHTGEVIVGNMGSRQRFDYTVLGDAANLASRLEGANKAFGSATMVSEATQAQAGDGFAFRALGALRAVGRREPVEVFELASEAAGSWGAFAEALAIWREGDVAQARERFSAIANDPVAQACAGMCDPDGKPIWCLTRK